jgi:hypothetical protein
MRNNSSDATTITIVFLNLGVALYQMAELDRAQSSFAGATKVASVMLDVTEDTFLRLCLGIAQLGMGDSQSGIASITGAVKHDKLPAGVIADAEATLLLLRGLPGVEDALRVIAGPKPDADTHVA